MAKLTDRTAYQGETLTATFEDAADATALNVTLKDGTASAVIAAVRSVDAWEWKATPEQLDGFEGRTNWVAMKVTDAGAAVIASGSIHIRPLVSKWREVVTAIEAAIQQWGTNPNHTVTCGEISITAKTIDDLITARDFYQRKADADEGGRDAAGGPRIMHTAFGR